MNIIFGSQISSELRVRAVNCAAEDQQGMKGGDVTGLSEKYNAAPNDIAFFFSSVSVMGF